MSIEREIKSAIRREYISDYASRERQKKPRLTKLNDRLGISGFFGVSLGLVGAFAGWIASYIAVPFAMTAVAVSGGVAVLGVVLFSVANAIDDHFTKRAEPILQADIANFKLVKSYIRDKLSARQKNLDKERKDTAVHHRSQLEEQDKKESEFAEKRKAALKMIAGGLDILDAENDAAAREIAFFRKEAEEALGPDFAAVAPKPQGESKAAAPTPDWQALYTHSR